MAQPFLTTADTGPQKLWRRFLLLGLTGVGPLTPPPPPGNGTFFGSRYFGAPMFGPHYFGTTAHSLTGSGGSVFEFFGARYFGPFFFGPRYYG